MGSTDRYAIGGILSILYFVFLVFGGDLHETNPVAAEILTFGLILFGTISVAYGWNMHKKYKNIFDYEPANFWGKPSNGLRVRNILTLFSVIGFWGIGTGLSLAFLISR